MADEDRLELWKDIPGYEGYYQVSDLGRVKSLSRIVKHKTSVSKTIPERLLKQCSCNKYGHLFVYLHKEGVKEPFLVHRLVLLVFVGICPEGQEVRHFPDRDPANNKLSNLKYGSARENAFDTFVHDTHTRGSRNRQARLTDFQVIEIVKSRNSNIPQTELACKYNVTQTLISKIQRGERWSWLTGIKPNA